MKRISDNKPLEVRGTIGGVDCRFLLDSGSDSSILSVDCFREIEKNMKVVLNNTKVQILTADRKPVKVLGLIDLNIMINGVNFTQDFLVAEIEDRCILGLDFMRSNHCVIDFSKQTFQVPGEAEVNWCRMTMVNNSELRENLTMLVSKNAEQWSSETADLLTEAVSKYQDVFIEDEKDIGRTNLVYHKIDTGTAKPIKQAPRRLPFNKQPVVDEMVQDLLSRDLIEPSQSPWSSPVVLVPKKGGKWRMCIDYRRLNEVTQKDSWPVPSIEQILESLRGQKWYSKIDLCSGYHQIEMLEEDREKTAFAVGNQLFQYKVMPFGLVNSGASFCRMMEKALAGISERECLNYIDDLLVPGETEEKAIENLEKVFQCLRSAGLKATPEKCDLLSKEVDFLGHRITAEGISTSEEKVDAVKNWPTPTSVKEVRKFVGFASYYRKFVKGFSAICKPLYKLTEKNQSFCWNADCNNAFLSLKEALTSAPVMAHPDENVEFILDTDASLDACGAVLSQIQDGKEKVIAYFSKAFDRAQRNYCVTRRELLAVVLSVKHFKHYLAGKEFLVRTDHASLKWLLSFKYPEGQIARWLEYLGSFQFRIEHRKGAEHVNADFLSRRPCGECKYCNRAAEKDRITEECEKEGHKQPRTLRVVTRSTGIPNIGLLQREDVDIGPLIEFMEKHGRKPELQELEPCSSQLALLVAQYDSLRLEHGVLYRRLEKDVLRTEKWQIVLPKVSRQEIFEQLHSSPFGGHAGFDRTFAKCKDRFYWPGYRRDVNIWCQRCDLCARRKGPFRKGRSPLAPRAVGMPLARCGIDIAGPFPLTEAGNKYIMVVTDHFTKFTEAYAIPSQDAKVVAKKLVEEFICRYGVMSELHADQAKNFESELISEVCKLMGIEKTRTTAFNPKSNGQTERHNRTILNSLSIFVQEVSDQARWDEFLPFVMMAYRSGQHASSGLTPAYLMFGRDLSLPVDLMYPRPPGEEMRSPSEYASELQQKLSMASDFARSNLVAVRDSMKLRYDKSTRLEALNEGDSVWLHNTSRKKGRSPKLAFQWEGPYVVEKVINKQLCRIRSKKRSWVVHRDRLWKVSSQDS